MISIIIIVIIVLFLLFIYFKFFKIPKLKNVVFLDGGLGSGKSFYSVFLAIKLHKRALRKWHFQNYVCKFLGLFSKNYKNKEVEKPLLYSNIKLKNYEHVILTKELLTRDMRFNYKSVVLIDEFSLFADQQLYKNQDLNEKLQLFFKLFRHETKGGYMIVNSQSINDCHYSFKYIINDYFYIHHRIKLPFISLLAIRENFYSADNGNVVNSSNEDIETTLKKVVVFNKYYKSYDSYCYSIFTDNLETDNRLVNFIKNDDLKADKLISFRDYKFLIKEVKNNEKK